jgi:hypothetical protein
MSAGNSDFDSSADRIENVERPFPQEKVTSKSRWKPLWAPPSGYQVDDQQDEGDHEQDVNQTAGYVKGEPDDP